MNLTKINQTMTTREIAELCGKDHKNVRRDCEVMFQGLGIDALTFERIYLDSMNRRQLEYVLDKELTYTLVTGYSVLMRNKIINRWQELEMVQKPQMPAIPQTYAEALQLAADQARLIEEQKPKVEVYEKLAERKGDVSTTILAKQLGVSAIKLNQWLREKGMKWKNADLPMAGYMDWFNVVADVKNGHEYSQCLITPLGQIEIAKRFTKH